MIVWILILLLAIGTFVAAYFAARTWHWANVTLSVLVFLTMILYVTLAAKVIQIRGVFGRRIASSTAELEDYQERNRALENGTSDSQIINRLAGAGINLAEGGEELPGIRDLNHRLHLRTRLRGTVWTEAGPAGPFDAQAGTIPVAVASPRPHGIPQNVILVAFERGDPSPGEGGEGRRYLGEFRVIEVGDEGVILQSVLDLDEVQQARLAASTGSWVLFESMPVDEHAIFEPLSDEQLQQLLPAQSVQEYIRQGGEPTADDDQWHRAAFDETGQLIGPDVAQETENVRYRYQRALRDYSFLYSELARERIVILADQDAIEQDIARLTEALAGARQLTAFREDEINQLNVDLAGVKKDLAAIERHLAQLNGQISVARKLLADTLADNSRKAAELAEFQKAAAATIGQQAAVSP